VTVAENGMAAHGVTVGGHGVARGAPQLARLRLGASVGRPRLEDALSATDGVVRRVREALDRFGVAREDAVTGWLSVQQIHHEGVYRCGHTIEVTVRELTRIGDLLAGVLVAGGDGATLDGVHFDVKDRARLTTEARAAAWDDAHRRAEELAAHAGRRLGAVTSVVEVEPAHRPMGRAMTFAAMDAGGPEAVDVEPGTVAVEVSLTVSWSFA
jgi:uncharacterized protein YggE